MRNFQDLPTDAQTRLLKDFQEKNIKFQDMESVFDVSPDSLRRFLVDRINADYEAVFPVPPAPKYQWTQPFRKLAVQIAISVLLLVSTFGLTFALEHIGIDPLTNELAIDLIRSMCIMICCFGFVDWFLFWKDPELFGYAESTITSPNDAAQDFNQLTPYQRCQTLMLRYLLYALVFILSFVALNLT